jgi:Uma2 family endonuclease
VARKRFTRQEVDLMIDAGVFAGQRFELLDGELVNKMGQNPDHSFTIQLVMDWLLKLFAPKQIRVQLSMLASGPDRESSVPEPDIAVLAEWKRDYQRRHPEGNELLLAVEVAGSSRVIDLTRKAELYARAGVPEYWVVDIDRRVIAVHRSPDGAQYRKIEFIPETDFVSLQDRPERIRVTELLPDPE